MIRRATTAALALLCAVTMPASAGRWERLYLSVPGPAAYQASLTPNNGWTVCKQRMGSLGRTHVAYTNYKLGLSVTQYDFIPAEREFNNEVQHLGGAERERSYPEWQCTDTTDT